MILDSRLERECDDENVPPIEGRPDFHVPRFGVTYAKAHPPFVYGTRHGACLVHKVRHVELHWYRVLRMDALQRLKRPVAIAQTMCAQSFRLQSDTCRTCRVPDPAALLCGRCHGEGPRFSRAKRSKDRRTGLTRREARALLGCVAEGE